MQSSTHSENVPRLLPMTRPPHKKSYRNREFKVASNYFKLRTLGKPHPIHPVLQYNVEIYRLKKKRKPRQNETSQEARKTLKADDPSFEWVDVTPYERFSFNRNVFREFVSRNFSSVRSRVSYDGRSTAFSSGQTAYDAMRNVLNTVNEIEVRMDGNPCNPNDTLGDKETTRLIIKEPKSLALDFLSNDKSTALPNEEQITALNLVLTSCMECSTNIVQLGRSFFDKSPNAIDPLNECADIWTGFFASVRPSQNNLLVNIDQMVTAVWKNSGRHLKELIRMLNGGFDVTSTAQGKDISVFLAGIRFRARHTRRVYKFYGFSELGVTGETFRMENNQEVTVFDYFSHEYPNFPLRDTRALCIMASPTGRVKLPVELLEIVEEQKYTNALSGEEIKLLQNASRSDPGRRLQNITLCKSHLGEQLGRAGLPILPSATPHQMVTARTLQEPTIQYRAAAVSAQRGQWRPHAKCTFRFPAYLASDWILIYVDRRENYAIKDFIRQLVNTGTAQGMTIGNPARCLRAARADDIVKEMRGNRTHNGVPIRLFVIVIRPGPGYEKIKSTGDIELGIATQVCLWRTWKPWFYSNLLLKINVKANGRNFIANFPQDFCFRKKAHIVLGADVTHGAPGGRSRSIAALVGINYSGEDVVKDFCASTVNVQLERQEIIARIGEMFERLFNTWSGGKKGYQCPNNIIMFRDGVSESQFEEVLGTEVQAIREAWRKLNQIQPLHLTYIIVTKRHHTKFFNIRSGGGAGNVKNIDAGTVVDNGIVSNRFYDFYLCSHEGIKGTSRPAKYTVLLDENKINSESLQQYIYCLCHNFGSCHRSVSLVNTVYYAHLLAARASVYLKAAGKLPPGLSDEGQLLELNRRVAVNDNLRSILFFL